MFNRHLPAFVYENLPRLYLAVAALLLLADSGWRWLPITCLVAAWYLTMSRRRRSRRRAMAHPVAAPRDDEAWIIVP